MDYRMLLEGLRELLDPEKKKIDFRPISWMNFEEYSTSKIFLSVVGLGENPSARNEVRFSRPIDDSSLSKAIAPLELKLLFASYSTNSTDYLEGIHQLNEIRTYFFNQPMIEISGNFLDVALFPLNFEEEYQLWRMLQVPHLPYFLFKVRILPQN
jgi:hypothetical protein